MGALGVVLVGCAKPGADDSVDIRSVAPNAQTDPARDTPQAPKDAQYTIFCRVFSEEKHVQDARQAQQELRDVTRMTKWYVVHSSDHSTLYYGFYRSIDPRDKKDGAEGQRAIDDQNKIRAIANSDGQRLFSEALLVGIDEPDPEANPAWDLTRAKGEWSIEIATYNVADRKTLAVDSVRAARAQGVEAYYYHGPTSSSVCIGCWPAESAVEITPEVLNPGPDAPFIVSDVPLADNVKKPLEQQGITTAAPHVEIQDPTLTAALHKWKEHSSNGSSMSQVDPATGAVIKVIEKPFLCKIPHRDPMDTMTSDQPIAPPPVQPTNPRPDGTPGEGQLRTIGE